MCESITAGSSASTKTVIGVASSDRRESCSITSGSESARHERISTSYSGSELSAVRISAGRRNSAAVVSP
jgi:hypothetical protein